MKTIIYYPSNHDATESQISDRITEYLNVSNFIVTRGNSRSVVVDFDSNISIQQLKDLDAAMITFGFQRY